MLKNRRRNNRCCRLIKKTYANFRRVYLFEIFVTLY